MNGGISITGDNPEKPTNVLHFKNWNSINWTVVIQHVNKLQTRIAKAIKAGKQKQLLLIAARKGDEMREPHAWKHARVVLGREDGSNPFFIFDDDAPIPRFVMHLFHDESNQLV